VGRTQPLDGRFRRHPDYHGHSHLEVPTLRDRHPPINRTLVYGSRTALLALIYFGVIVVLQRVFVTLTGQQSTLAVVASTLLIAALFTPLRRRIQSFIDRRFYRRKYDARKTLESFSAQLRKETDLDALSDDLVGVVTETMQPPVSRYGCAQIRRRRLKSLANRPRR
jgi:hypothetical protein